MLCFPYLSAVSKWQGVKFKGNSTPLNTPFFYLQNICGCTQGILPAYDSLPVFWHRWLDNVLFRSHVLSHALLLLKWTCDRTALGRLCLCANLTLRLHGINFSLPPQEVRLSTQTLLTCPSHMLRCTFKCRSVCSYRLLPSSALENQSVLKGFATGWACVGMSQQTLDLKALLSCNLKMQIGMCKQTKIVPTVMLISN